MKIGPIIWINNPSFVHGNQYISYVQTYKKGGNRKYIAWLHVGYDGIQIFTTLLHTYTFPTQFLQQRRKKWMLAFILCTVAVLGVLSKHIFFNHLVPRSFQYVFCIGQHFSNGILYSKYNNLLQPCCMQSYLCIQFYFKYGHKPLIDIIIFCYSCNKYNPTYLRAPVINLQVIMYQRKDYHKVKFHRRVIEAWPIYVHIIVVH